MIIKFVKNEGFPIVCVATSTCRYDTERGSRRVKQFVSYSFVCCQENESYLTSVFSNQAISGENFSQSEYIAVGVISQFAFPPLARGDPSRVALCKCFEHV